jgi:hypothetical protein
MFYTYAYLRKDGTPYYIGKGSGNRLFSNKHSVNLPDKGRIIYLKRNITENEALKHEEYMIKIYGRKIDGGLLYNISLGGKGNSKYFTEEDRKKSRKKSLEKYQKSEQGKLKRIESQRLRRKNFSEERKENERRKAKERERKKRLEKGDEVRLKERERWAKNKEEMCRKQRERRAKKKQNHDSFSMLQNLPCTKKSFW